MKTLSISTLRNPAFLSLWKRMPFLLLLCISLSMQAQSGQKYAFLVGIGDYPQEGGWQKIHATHDLTVISAALEKRGFPAKNMLVLKDKEATRQGILDAWNKRFIPQIKPGDVVYFHFSGHGQQVADDQQNGDEIDGYDEAIVPYDSPLKYEAGVYQGENLIRDDDLNRLFTNLRAQLGSAGNLMVVIDACHSGTGTRGMTPARGTDRPMASTDYVKANLKKSGEDLATQQFAAEDERPLAPMAAFFGSAHNQLNFEARDEQGQLLGSLSYAMSKKLAEAPLNTSYRGLFEQIRLEMSVLAPRQQPQAEGTLDQELLGGQLLEQPAYMEVERANNETQIVLDAGSIQGLNPGAIVALYPPETRDTTGIQPLARGTVKNVLPFKAIVDLDKPVKMKTAKSAWVNVLEHNFGDLKLGFSIQLPETNLIRQALKNRLDSNPVIRLEEAPEVFLVEENNEFHLIGQGDVLLRIFTKHQDTATITREIIKALKGHCRIKYIRQMEASSPFLNVDFEIIPIKTETTFGNSVKETGLILLTKKQDAQGNLHFQDGDVFKIRVVNKGRKAAYFTLVDLQPDNISRCLIPAQDDINSTPGEFKVAPGQSMDVPGFFGIGPPAGVEMFKLFATTEPIDLRPIMNSGGVSTRGVGDKPFESLFKQTYLSDDVQTRGGKTINLAAGSLHISSHTFIID